MLICNKLFCTSHSALSVPVPRSQCLYTHRTIRTLTPNTRLHNHGLWHLHGTRRPRNCGHRMRSHVPSTLRRSLAVRARNVPDMSPTVVRRRAASPVRAPQFEWEWQPSSGHWTRRVQVHRLPRAACGQTVVSVACAVHGHVSHSGRRTLCAAAGAERAAVLSELLCGAVHVLRTIHCSEFALERNSPKTATFKSKLMMFAHFRTLAFDGRRDRSSMPAAFRVVCAVDRCTAADTICI